MSHSFVAVKHSPTHFKLRPMAHPQTTRSIVSPHRRRRLQHGSARNQLCSLAKLCFSVVSICLLCTLYSVYGVSMDRFCGITEVASNFQSPTRPVHEGRRRRQRRPSTLHQSRNPAVKSSPNHSHTHTHLHTLKHPTHINTFITKFVLPVAFLFCCLFYLFVYICVFG